MNVLIFVMFVLFNIILAAIDANKIKHNKKIYHGVNGLIYGGLLFLTYLLIPSWNIILGSMLIRIPVFNTALNYFRELPLMYLSESTTSIVDKLTNFIPKKIGYWAYNSIILLTSLILILL